MIWSDEKDILELERYFDGLNSGLAMLTMTGLDTTLPDEMMDSNLIKLAISRVSQLKKCADEAVS